MRNALNFMKQLNSLREGNNNMDDKKIIAYIDAQNELDTNLIQLANQYANQGADEILLYDYSKDESCGEKLLSVAKKITKDIDIPLNLGLYVRRFEDIKKALYTGAEKVVIKDILLEDYDVVKEAVKRFGENKIFLEIQDYKILSDDLIEIYKKMGICGVLLKHINLNTAIEEKIMNLPFPVIIRDSLSRNDIYELISIPNVYGIATNYFENNYDRADFILPKNKDIMKAKTALKNQGIPINTLESILPFSEFTLDSNGFIPVIVQDYKTSKVLMLAYMNEEAYHQTIATGRMTYYSRSRGEIWIKGLTSGHFQYVQSMTIDCDKDTILAKVKQVGAACHTGSKTCFYTNLFKKDYNDTNPLTVFQDVYDVILDRKNNPKEGSYTNYLFDKGIDKILKKCGEEATEMVIAAKNPDAEELKYEISDFLYHMMVLMAECNLDWNDVVKELAHRR